MHNELLIALLAGLGGMLGWGFADFFAKKTVDEISSVASLVWAHAFGALAFAVIIWIKILIIGERIALPNNLMEWGWLLFFGVLQAVVYLLVYQGFSKGKLAVLNPIFASYSGLAALLSVVVFGEIVSGHLLLALSTIFAGILFLNLDTQALLNKRLNLLTTPGVKEMVLAALFAAVWTVLWDKFLGGKDWLIFALFMYTFMTFTALAIAKIQKINLNVTRPGLWKFLMLIGFCEVIAYLSISLGFSTTSYTSIIALLSGSFSLPTLILAHIFLKERVTKLQRAGSIIIIAGIIILSLR